MNNVGFLISLLEDFKHIEFSLDALKKDEGRVLCSKPNENTTADLSMIKGPIINALEAKEVEVRTIRRDYGVEV